MITPLLRKGDYIYGSFVKPEHINGYINNTNPGDLSDHLGRVPFSLSNTNEAIAYTKIIAPTWTQTPLVERQNIVKKFLIKKDKHLKFITHTKEVIEIRSPSGLNYRITSL